MSKARAQGTTHETWIVNELNGLGFTARRLPEGGTYDEGDVETTINEVRWVLEAKARQTLNVQETLGKARKKAGGNPVAVIWKRLVRVAGTKNRQPIEGERIVVVLSWEDFISLINANAPMVNNSTIVSVEGCECGCNEEETNE